jgi:acetoin utilization deacetylase AcuC-like enzyme
MLVVSSSRFADHVTPPGHPESPERADVLEAIAARAKGRGEEVVAPREASRDELLRVHMASHLDAVESTRGHARMIDADTFTSPDTADVAALAAGATVQAVEAVLVPGERSHRAAAALVRPPGHHAESGRAMGFCFYNNVAVAAAHARARGMARVAVVDYDVHHGNGTQEMFYADPSVLYISTHQFPFYPGTGAARETGVSDGLGFTVNVPLEAGATDGDYVRVFELGVLPILEEFRPGLILISAGFDAHEQDPLAQMRMTSAGFAWMTTGLREMADRVSDGRVVLVTEGGYALPALGESLDLALGALAGDADVRAPSAMRAATGRGDRALTALAAAQAGRWHGL